MQNDFPDDTFLARWLNGELSEAELAALKAREDYETLRRIVQYSEVVDVPTYQADQAWQQLQTKRRGQPQPKVRRLRYGMLLAAAASVALLFGWYFLLRTTVLSYDTNVGEQLTLQLPDASEVILNAKSQLTYDPAQWEAARTVTLRGEAFFSVAPGQTFSVQTAQGAVEVLGTSFNVFSRAEVMDVRCYTGQVMVSNEVGETTLEPGQKVVVTAGNVPTADRFGLTESPSWLRGWIDYPEGAALRQVFAEMERQYGKTIVFTGEANRVYKGGFPTGDLPAALKFVCEPMNLTFSIEGDRIIIQ